MRKAVRFNVKVELGGLVGLIAPLLGKQPHDTSVWILGGEAPGFVRSEGPMYSASTPGTLAISSRFSRAWGVSIIGTTMP